MLGLLGATAGDVRFMLGRMMGTQNEDHRREADFKAREFLTSEANIQTQKQISKDVGSLRNGSTPSAVEAYASSDPGRSRAVASVRQASAQVGAGISSIG